MRQERTTSTTCDQQSRWVLQSHRAEVNVLLPPPGREARLTPVLFARRSSTNARTHLLEAPPFSRRYGSAARYSTGRVAATRACAVCHCGERRNSGSPSQHTAVVPRFVGILGPPNSALLRVPPSGRGVMPRPSLGRVVCGASALLAGGVAVARPSWGAEGLAALARNSFGLVPLESR